MGTNEKLEGHLNLKVASKTILQPEDSSDSEGENENTTKLSSKPSLEKINATSSSTKTPRKRKAEEILAQNKSVPVSKIKKTVKGGKSKVSKQKPKISSRSSSDTELEAE